ncbi:MAG: cytoplasmic protein [Proteobacteria bacterium]|nr:cytoplasmic protein [Pseudomonadota bacterium]MBU1581605.1 cytoplasmic protein [Pseudomonadota bacterium]MBU2456021.1 cytoplasmic protein [Pseudomonadota bacterium]
MGGNSGTPNSIDFTVDKKNLFREESVTDLKIATIRQLIPIHLDGTLDGSRETIFIGSSQLGTPQGPIPIQAKLEVNTLEQALDIFPKAMEAETQKVIESFKKMQAQQEQKKKAEKSRIIVPGVN